MIQAATDADRSGASAGATASAATAASNGSSRPDTSRRPAGVTSVVERAAACVSIIRSSGGTASPHRKSAPLSGDFARVGAPASRAAPVKGAPALEATQPGKYRSGIPAFHATLRGFAGDGTPSPGRAGART